MTEKRKKNKAGVAVLRELRKVNALISEVSTAEGKEAAVKLNDALYDLSFAVGLVVGQLQQFEGEN